jgi:hypothetical protein
MTESDAAILVGMLQAAFPAGGSAETAVLYRKHFERYDSEPATRAVNDFIATRTEPFLPTWAEIRSAILRNTPEPHELEPAVVGAPQEARDAMRRLKEALAERAEQLTEFDKLRAAVRRRYVADRDAGRLGESTGVPGEAK